MSVLDQLVKGAPAPDTDINQVASAAFANPPSHGLSGPPNYGSNPSTSNSPASAYAFSHPPTHDANDRLASLQSSLKTPRPPQPPSDPTSLLPSSPPQIYLNLLIMEASLRTQYLTLRARRRQNTFVLTLLAVWMVCFTYLMWLRPRDDGSGIGGSQYWLLDMIIKMCFITGCVTLILFWATGQWERGVRWPRRWIGVANRGLRGMNCKIVVMKGGWVNEILGWIKFVMPIEGGLWGGEGQSGSSYHFINLSQEKWNGLSDGRPRHRMISMDGKEYAEEDIAPGGDYIKLLLLPKPFSPDFRENWEIYRTEYWERENARRAELRKKVRARQREMAREEGGILWWTGWRGWKRARGMPTRAADVEKVGLGHHHSLSATGSIKDRKRRSSTLRGREGSFSISHSRSSSRSTTPTPDLDERLRLPERERRWSTSTTGSTATSVATARSDSRRSTKAPASLSLGTNANSSRAGRQGTRVASGSQAGPAAGSSSRPSTPGELPWQSKRASGLNQAESLSDWDGEAGGRDGVGRRDFGSEGEGRRESRQGEGQGLREE